MNLNPLKKDDNTDALVQALQDANNVGTTDAPAVQDAADTTIATDDVTAIVDTQIPDDTLVTEDTTATTDAAASISFGGNDLPAGLSSDADAHLPTADLGGSGDLEGVKKSALEQLRPLIEKIDLEPADKFDKYLMMLRASDDPALIKPAFDAAQGIGGEKEKAQALLDIINEINYITANQQQ